ncbi:hypothetical protein [Dyella nitratireducens]|uniref:N-acetyltransferase domain-containing protein n=1 Tax=Dyella nitratireducens TaxID=1849580 RepID=A0ABQ1G878_9GAMM|nr:hypothetical protein [Dyella nitratireducens]GGA38616.1 hypothetical protein GCM10010981_29820 [Dyella nitratireducens]GLQ40339.1 hypothetical protein GCM10007902_01880 [Dyella nitratireducens]
MPTIIPMSRIFQAGRHLGKGKVMLSDHIEVEMDDSTMIIKEKGLCVFSMKKMDAAGDYLLLDYPQIAEGQGGRGWGILGMLIALQHGLFMGCQKISICSPIQMTRVSTRFWLKFGINDVGNPLIRLVHEKAIKWVLDNCEQRFKEATDFVLRD